MEISYWLIIIGALGILMATILGQKLSGKSKLVWWVVFIIVLTAYAYLGIRLEFNLSLLMALITIKAKI